MNEIPTASLLPAFESSSLSSAPTESSVDHHALMFLMFVLMRMSALWATLVGLLAVSTPLVDAFVLHTPRLARHRPLHRPLTTHLSSASSSDDSPGIWKLPNDFETFVNQVTVQSFLFLLKSMRDPQTVLWLEGFVQPAIGKPKQPDFPTEPAGKSSQSKLLTYHGLHAFNTTLFPTWDTFFAQLLEQEPVVLHIESASAHIPNYELDINPASLCSRIVSVREQICREFVRDLGVVAQMGGHTLESYWESLRALRESDGVGDAKVKVQRENLLFLEFSADEDSDYAPSPLRKGNFDLLVLLATQESIHRVLNDASRQSGAVKASNAFLRNFYAERLRSHFTGSQRYGRADDFLEELLSEPPRTMQVDDTTSLIDPTRLAELILDAREGVAEEWREICRSAPQKHFEIKRKQLSLLIGRPSSSEPEGEFQ